MSHVRDYRDIIGGSLLFVFGLFVVIYGISHYQFGTLTNMGPSFFPVIIGVLITACGLAIAIPAFQRPGLMPTFELRPAVAVLGGGIVFAYLIGNFGLVPAVLALVIISAYGDDKLKWTAKIVLAVALVALAILIFKIGLNMPVSYIEWPF